MSTAVPLSHKCNKSLGSHPSRQMGVFITPEIWFVKLSNKSRCPQWGEASSGAGDHHHHRESVEALNVLEGHA